VGGEAWCFSPYSFGVQLGGSRLAPQLKGHLGSKRFARAESDRGITADEIPC
jgi:hypothetical protein